MTDQNGHDTKHVNFERGPPHQEVKQEVSLSLSDGSILKMNTSVSVVTDNLSYKSINHIQCNLAQIVEGEKTDETVKVKTSFWARLQKFSLKALWWSLIGGMRYYLWDGWF